MVSKSVSRHSVFRFESHLAYRRVLLHFIQLSLEAANHIIPNIHKAHLYHIKLFLPLHQERSPLTLMFDSLVLELEMQEVAKRPHL